MVRPDTQGERRQETVAPPGTSRPARIALMMALVLAVQTAAEYILALVVDKNLPIMVAINLSEAALIMIYFMHLPRLWRGREES
jgi:hypothetical protein